MKNRKMLVQTGILYAQNSLTILIILEQTLGALEERSLRHSGSNPVTELAQVEGKSGRQAVGRERDHTEAWSLESGASFEALMLFHGSRSPLRTACFSLSKLGIQDPRLMIDGF